MKKYNPNLIYIVFDGTSYYGLYGCDIQDEIANAPYNATEVVEGPFNEWPDDRIEKLNNEIQI